MPFNRQKKLKCSAFVHRRSVIIKKTRKFAYNLDYKLKNKSTTTMNKTFPKLIQTIIEGIQEKKGRDIVVCNLTKFTSAPAQYFVVCTGNTPQQVDAIIDSVENFTGEKEHEKPCRITGRNNSTWVVADYGTVMVHVLVPMAREFYDIENIWEDAKISTIPNLD